ncbi:unnamed protein product [Adineta steineri]|uniref:LRAT domain-containing protein n=1 Tax=Adineta steineri TaxID=433720 RepID=A0A814J582_9BILA|nr:unnamed protein product [Adineta steineri]CAF4022200.1 unnamed protein product [Adineta steineri]
MTSEETTLKNEDELVGLNKNSFRSEKWAYTVFSAIESAFKSFWYIPRYSKEACVLHPRSPALKSSLDIARGDVLCAKRYVGKMKSVALASYYHFGVYVGSIKTSNGRELHDAVIHLQKDSENRNIFINATSLVSKEKGEGFIYENPDSKHPPLLFKVIYKDRTQAQQNETAERAEEIYRNVDPNVDRYADKYSLVSNNCEHFVNICAFGTPHCEQHARFMMTTIPGFFKASPVIAKFVRYIMPIVAQISEGIVPILHYHLSYIGESIALGMLLLECVVRIFWDIYLLQQSGCLTRDKFMDIMKKRLIPIAPELLSAIAFLLVSVICASTSFIGIGIGIVGLIIVLVLRFTTRPRLERWIQERELARREDFFQWYPSEVARLVMKTAEDELNEGISAKFQSEKLSGKAITEMIQKQRQGVGDVSFETKFQFLSPEKLSIFKQNLDNIFGHLSLEDLKSSVTVIYEGKSLTIKPSLGNPITVGHVLDMGRLNWGIDFLKGKWQLATTNADDGNKTVIASWIRNSIDETIDIMPDTSIKLDLSYAESDGCALM